MIKWSAEKGYWSSRAEESVDLYLEDPDNLELEKKRPACLPTGQVARDPVSLPVQWSQSFAAKPKAAAVLSPPHHYSSNRYPDCCSISKLQPNVSKIAKTRLQSS